MSKNSKKCTLKAFLAASFAVGTSLSAGTPGTTASTDNSFYLAGGSCGGSGGCGGKNGNGKMMGSSHGKMSSCGGSSSCGGKDSMPMDSNDMPMDQGDMSGTTAARNTIRNNRHQANRQAFVAYEEVDAIEQQPSFTSQSRLNQTQRNKGASGNIASGEKIPTPRAFSYPSVAMGDNMTGDKDSPADNLNPDGTPKVDGKTAQVVRKPTNNTTTYR